ncbi:LamG-like jellyroll fold domain-containing protein [Pseudomarimonas salicorniae]|uniref:LamG-like jellyroll fold domain-containing protein n=1 Tax=Pseudomarimonas salicorniae TaxID=2933270 RepID=A0ABT0GGC8_9GAMM|nr:LamG-like jellyroll fold domain-containing protein [Lysobacter sp. CAU 1642]MCK7593070.1 hypothetical protein [Lysobacter sp. CAU 1642]
MKRSVPSLFQRWILLLLLAVFGLPAVAQRIDDSITAHYPFENNLDEAAGVNTRPVVRGTLEYAVGALGRSAKVSGDDEIDFGGIPGSTFAGDFTVAFFVNLEGAGAQALFSKETTCDAGDRFKIGVANGSPARLSFQLANATTQASANATVPRSQWVHVAAVRSGSQALVYVDGVADRSASLPSLNLGAISAPFGLATSPCIGRTLGLTRAQGRIDELRIYPRAVDAATIAGLARRPSFAVAPARATPGAQISVSASHLVVDRTYEVRLSGTTRVTLFRGPATATSMTWPITLPEAAAGRYELQLVAVLLRSLENVERSVSFDVAPRLSITSSPSAQAGKKATFTLGNLVRGNQTRLFYGGRLLAGPEAAGGTTHAFSVVLPRDFPASLPASVALRAEQLSGRSVSHLGTGSVSVAAPFAGRFAPVQQLSSSRTQVPPDEKVRINGQLGFADGASASNVEVSAFWMGDDGSVTPLPTSLFDLSNTGSLFLETRPPSLEAMTAVRPDVGGRIRLAKKRTNEFGRVEWEFEEGPRLETINDTDPDTDITVRVLRRTTQGTEPLAGAYVVVSANAPLGYTFDPPTGSGGESNASIGGGSLYLHRQPSLRQSLGPAKALQSRPGAVNQVNNEIADLPPPPAPACGEDLYRRYTDGTGRAEFPVLGGPEQTPAGWQAVQSTQFSANECSSFGCRGVQVSRVYSFQVSVYTLHLGAGYRNADRSEDPVRFNISYFRDTETFRITNLRTGETTEQQVSANLHVEVPNITGTDNFITFGDPIMYHELGGQVIGPVNRIGSGFQLAFGKWVDFGDLPTEGGSTERSRVSEFVNPSPDKVIEFEHRPDVNGSISSAKLFLTNLITGQPSYIGDFQQVSFFDGCNLQNGSDLSLARAETWRLRLPSELANSWRFPRGVLFPQSGPMRACGHIAVENARGGSGRRNLCFHWQQGPGSMYGRGGPITVNDADMFDVQVEDSGYVVGQGQASIPKRETELLGEKIDKPGRIDNETNVRSGSYSSLGPNGPTSGSRQVGGNNPKQFSEGASGKRTQTDNAEGGSVVEFGSDEYQTVLDATIPLFKWYWGVPEILSAEVFAELRLIAKYLFSGSIRRVNGVERIEGLTNAVFITLITIGVDIDVLFGLLVDAGASLSGLIISEMPVILEDGEVQTQGPCITFGLDFSYWIDPCPVCPTPAFGDTLPVLEARAPEGCGFFSASDRKMSPLIDPEVAKLARVTAKDVQLGFDQARELRRQPALAFDRQGNGQMLMLNASRGLSASGVSAGGTGPQATLSTAMGIREPQVTYFDAERGLAVWAESELPESEFRAASYPTLVAAQRLVYAEWDGEQWGEKRTLTAATSGDGRVTLAACPAGAANCPAGGEVVAVWQRNASGNALAPQYRLWHATFRPGTGFGPAAPVDTSPTQGVQDITPSATYVGGRPVLVWTRQFGPAISNFAQRNLAYRVLPNGNPTVLAAAPAASAPSAVSVGSSGLRVAWLRADPNTSSNPQAARAGAVGTQQALYVAQAICNATTCSFPEALIPAARDQHGRRIYGERPRLVRGENDAFVVMRVFRLQGDASEAVYPGDPIGTVLNSAEVILFTPNFATGVGRILPLTADGATHMGVFAAFNPAAREIVTGSSIFLPPNAGPMRAALKATGFKGHVAYSKQIASAGPVELRATVDAPDLALEKIEPQSELSPSTAQSTRLTIGNRGAGYTLGANGVVMIELRWNSPGGALLGSYTLDSIGAGEERVVELAWTAPASAHPDEPAVLVAMLVAPGSFNEVTGDNNQLQFEYPGMPVPQQLASGAIPGVPQVQLGWEPMDDSRIAGYRVYRQGGEGNWIAMGASPTHGFLDLSASFNTPRTYAISSYSSRGVESELSEAITVMPVPQGSASQLPFVDGFEARN